MNDFKFLTHNPDFDTLMKCYILRMYNDFGDKSNNVTFYNNQYGFIRPFIWHKDSKNGTIVKLHAIVNHIDFERFSHTYQNKIFYTKSTDYSIEFEELQFLNSIYKSCTHHEFKHKRF